MKLLPPSGPHDASIPGLCAPQVHTILQDPHHQQQTGPIVADDCCKDPTPPCQLQLRSLSGSTPVPCMEQPPQMPSLLPPGWLPGFQVLPPAYAGEASLAAASPAGAAVLAPPPAAVRTPALPAPSCALPAATPAAPQSAPLQEQSIEGICGSAAAPAAAGCCIEEGELPMDRAGIGLNWDGDTAPAPARKRGRPCHGPKTSATVKDVCQQVGLAAYKLLCAVGSLLGSVCDRAAT